MGTIMPLVNLYLPGYFWHNHEPLVRTVYVTVNVPHFSSSLSRHDMPFTIDEIKPPPNAFSLWCTINCAWNMLTIRVLSDESLEENFFSTATPSDVLSNKWLKHYFPMLTEVWLIVVFSSNSHHFNQSSVNFSRLTICEPWHHFLVELGTFQIDLDILLMVKAVLFKV